MEDKLIDNQDDNSLRGLIISLKYQVKFIFGFTALITLLGTLYLYSLPPAPFYADTSFTKSNELSAAHLNNFGFIKESPTSIFQKFLTLVDSRILKLKALENIGYKDKISSEFNSSKDLELDLNTLLNSVKLEVLKHNDYKNENIIGYDFPYALTIKGRHNQKDILSPFLNELIALADSKTKDIFNNRIKVAINLRLNNISKERKFLIEQAKNQRLNLIKKIKESQSKELKELHDQIDRLTFKSKEYRLNSIVELTQEIKSLRYKAKENRLNEISALNDAAKLAKSIGIIENNFKLISDDQISTNLTIFGKINDLPQWYLYGEKALLEKVEILKSRTSDDPYIPELVGVLNRIESLRNQSIGNPFIKELVDLLNQLNTVQNNNTLLTLEKRQDDEIYIDEIIDLDLEKKQLESIDIDFGNFTAMKIHQAPVINQVKQASKNIMLAVIIFLGLLLGILLAIMINIFNGIYKLKP